MAPLVIPSCTRNSIMVVFKTDAPPHRSGPRGEARPQPDNNGETSCRYLIYLITIIKYNCKADSPIVQSIADSEPRSMPVSKSAAAELAKTSRAARKQPAEAGAENSALQLGELSELLGYSLKRAQLKIFENFLRCVAPLQLTPAQFSVLLLLDKNPGRNQTEIANTLGILRPNFVAMLDALESRDLCARMRSTNDRRSHILMLTDKGRAVLARAKKLVAAKHEARLNEVLGPANRAALLEMLATIAREL